MNPKQIVRLGVVALVATAVIVVLRIRQTESEGSTEGHAVSVGDVAPAEAETPAAPSVLPRLLDLGAGKCIPCKKMAPILEKLRVDFAGQFDVVFIDVWKNKEAATSHRIRLIPTQIFFDEAGNELFRHEGFYSREDILARWSELEYVFAAPPEGDTG